MPNYIRNYVPKDKNEFNKKLNYYILQEAEIKSTDEPKAPTPEEVKPETKVEAPKAEVKPSEEPKQTFKCDSCDFSCETERGIKTHIRRKHGVADGSADDSK